MLLFGVLGICLSFGFGLGCQVKCAIKVSIFTGRDDSYSDANFVKAKAIHVSYSKMKY